MRAWGSSPLGQFAQLTIGVSSAEVVSWWWNRKGRP